MAMLLFPFSKSSGGARRALRTSAWAAALSARASALIAAALIALMFSGQAWGQSMHKNLIGNNNVIPANANTAFTNQVPTNARMEDLVDVTGDTSLDPDNNGFLNPVSGIDVVDWVLVQARVVDEPGGDTATPVPGGGAHCNDNTCVTKAALLLTDGSIVDAGGDNEGNLVVFEELDFDDTGQELFIALYHRNHVTILSALGAGEIDDEGVITYNLDESGKVFNNGALIQIGSSGKYAVRAGNTDLNTVVVNTIDYGAVTNNLGRTDFSYETANTDLNSVVNSLDYSAITANLGITAFINFFPTN